MASCQPKHSQLPPTDYDLRKLVLACHFLCTADERRRIPILLRHLKSKGDETFKQFNERAIEKCDSLKEICEVLLTYKQMKPNDLHRFVAFVHEMNLEKMDNFEQLIKDYNETFSLH
ncbi:unnamed protein product [Didymodactylos carnosus]|uniref:Uncharacterized protein n=1 Tax=Didymodactylos carnosus TaxID=1234261 RepID=A0A814SNN3_9BILA|nr:unnamed protein product [Didymodactylos carnosus]CAF1149765.1 unnamed protein product [Didymodactylos carnosus]CAF3872886.1 unnamed protein product [Didymodactylos carnosus]CAF3913235.1 unnamed protein product [Didymodactylos carnosus]